MTDARRPDLGDLALRLASRLVDDTADERLHEWRAREYRLAQTDEEVAETARSAQRFSTAVRAAIAARHAGVRRVMEGPSWCQGDGKQPGAAVAPYYALAVAAGAGRLLWDQAPDAHLSLPRGLAPGRYVALPVRGRSMEPLLADGDVVLVARDVAPRRGRIVVARDEDDGYVVKRFGDVVGVSIVFESLNPEYADLEVQAAPGVILGTVVLAWGGKDGATR